MGFCIVCKERWAGRGRAHCTGCHRTFNSVGGFDSHRKGMKCIHPEDIGMVMKEGIWAKPMPEDYKNTLGKQIRGAKFKTLAGIRPTGGVGIPS